MKSLPLDKKRSEVNNSIYYKNSNKLHYKLKDSFKVNALIYLRNYTVFQISTCVHALFKTRNKTSLFLTMFDCISFTFLYLINLKFIEDMIIFGLQLSIFFATFNLFLNPLVSKLCHIVPIHNILLSEFTLHHTYLLNLHTFRVRSKVSNLSIFESFTLFYI